MFTSEHASRALVAAAWAVIAVVACGTEPRSRDEGTGSGGGAAGQAGASGAAGHAAQSGSGGTTSGRGGSNTERGGRGGTSGASSGAGGTPAGDGGAATGGAMGEGGASGEAGDGGIGDVPEWPREGDPCSMDGYDACPGPQATYWLTCDGTTWRRANDCGTEQLCDRRTGRCASVDCDPNSTASICSLDAQAELYCGPDKIGVYARTCAFTCREMVGCVEPGDDQVYVDRPRAIEVSDNPWPGPLIPACLENPDEWREEELAAVLDAFHRTWGRYARIALTELEPCSTNAHGVTLTIAEACGLELARIPSTGYPGPGATLPVTLCRSYEDSRGIVRDVAPALFDHAVVHVFGHVLGYPDKAYAVPSGTVMMQAIDLSRVPTLPFASTFDGTGMVEATQKLYGIPPEGSLSGPAGRCLSFGAPSDEPLRTACDGAPERRFRALGGRFEHVATGQCLKRLDGDRVGLGACDDAERWETRRVNWLTHTGRCMTAPLTANAQRPLVYDICKPSRAEEQTFHFEFVAPDRALVRLVRDQRCVLWPANFSQRITPELGSCTDARAVFETSRGVLATAGRCLRANPDVQFSACDGGNSQRFALSGPLESQAGALTLVSDGGGVELRAAPLGNPIDATQIFDFYF
jgi:hypothetical protein